MPLHESFFFQGTTYVYESFFRPYLSQHERDIDHSLLELRTRAGDMAVIYWQRVSSYGQTRIFEILQYVAAQSTPRPPQQPQVHDWNNISLCIVTYNTRFWFQKRGGRANQVPVKPKKSPSVQPESEEAASSSSSSSDSDGNDAAGKEAGPTSGPATDTKSAGITQIVQKLVSSPPTQSTTQVEAEPMQIEEVGGEGEAESVNGNSNPEGPKETVMEQTIRMTRGRLRKTRSEESRWN